MHIIVINFLLVIILLGACASKRTQDNVVDQVYTWTNIKDEPIYNFEVHYPHEKQHIPTIAVLGSRHATSHNMQSPIKEYILVDWETYSGKTMKVKILVKDYIDTKDLSASRFKISFVFFKDSLQCLVEKNIEPCKYEIQYIDESFER